jgi:hypothetical protein
MVLTDRATTQVHRADARGHPGGGSERVDTRTTGLETTEPLLSAEHGPLALATKGRHPVDRPTTASRERVANAATMPLLLTAWMSHHCSGNRCH